jgi:hypothetical protein
MEERPKGVVIASGIALVGAFSALIAIVFGLDLAAEGLGLKMSIFALSLALFLAIAGSLFKNGQWSWRFLIFMEVFCAILPVIAYIFGYIDFLYVVVFVFIAALTVLFTTSADTKRWVEADRV